MNKKIVSVMTIIALIATMIVSVPGDNGDNTGQDNMPCTTEIPNSFLLGDYQLGTPKEFIVRIWASSSAGKTVKKEIEITGEHEVSDFEFKDTDNQWKDASLYNTEMILKNNTTDVRVTFQYAGVYKIKASLYTLEGEEVYSAERNIRVSDTEIALYVPSVTDESTSPDQSVDPDEPTSPDQSVDPDEPTTPEKDIDPDEPTTSEKDIDPDEPTTSEKDINPDEPTTTEKVKEPEEPTAKENITGKEQPTSGADKMTTKPEVSEVTTKASDTPKETVSVKTAKIKKQTKSLTSKKIKITLKKIKGADKYQIQISKTKKFKKPLVQKTVKKVKATIRSKKLVNRKKLYTRARAVVLSKGVQYYGNWSKAKKVKIKK